LKLLLKIHCPDEKLVLNELWKKLNQLFGYIYHFKRALDDTLGFTTPHRHFTL